MTKQQSFLLINGNNDVTQCHSKNEATRSSFMLASLRKNQEEHERNLLIISLVLLYTYCHSETLEIDDHDQATVISLAKREQ
jgi:hypothetical protein